VSWWGAELQHGHQVSYDEIAESRFEQSSEDVGQQQGERCSPGEKSHLHLQSSALHYLSMKARH